MLIAVLLIMLIVLLFGGGFGYGSTEHELFIVLVLFLTGYLR